MGGDVSGHLSDSSDGIAQFLIGEAPYPRPIHDVSGLTEMDALVAQKPYGRSVVQENPPALCAVARSVQSNLRPS
jgi:hypothetical protein